MLLTQYSKHLILVSQYSLPNLISDSQSDKNKGKKGQRRKMKASVIFLFFSFFLKLKTDVCLHVALSIGQVGKEITK